MGKEETDTKFWVENVFGRDNFRERGVYDFYVRFIYTSAQQSNLIIVLTNI
jgi:hypothetical protein